MSFNKRVVFFKTKNHFKKLSCLKYEFQFLSSSLSALFEMILHINCRIICVFFAADMLLFYVFNQAEFVMESVFVFGFRQFVDFKLMQEILGLL